MVLSVYAKFQLHISKYEIKFSSNSEYTIKKELIKKYLIEKKVKINNQYLNSREIDIIDMCGFDMLSDKFKVENNIINVNDYHVKVIIPVLIKLENLDMGSYYGLHNSILMEEVYKEIQDFDDVLFAGEIEDV
jgi:hypothetical protein